MNTRHDETNKECKLNITIQEGRNGHKYALQLGVSNEDWVNLNCSCRPPEQKDNRPEAILDRVLIKIGLVPTPKDTREEKCEHISCGGKRCHFLDNPETQVSLSTHKELREEWKEHRFSVMKADAEKPFPDDAIANWWLPKVEEAREEGRYQQVITEGKNIDNIIASMCEKARADGYEIGLEAGFDKTLKSFDKKYPPKWVTNSLKRYAHHQWIERVREWASENSYTPVSPPDFPDEKASVTIDDLNTLLTEMEKEV